MDQENFLIEEGNFLTEYSVKRKRFPELWPSVIIRQRILHYSDQLWPVHHNPSGSMNLKLFMGVWNSSHAIPFSICLRSLSLSLFPPHFVHHQQKKLQISTSMTVQWALISDFELRRLRVARYLKATTRLVSGMYLTASQPAIPVKALQVELGGSSNKGTLNSKAMLAPAYWRVFRVRH